ncbi:MAG: DNA mismatch repair endonuclease MutL [Bacteroides sp.]|nr:DNA mismatch repair endonuclease MutL [Bacteroides sp.]
MSDVIRLLPDSVANQIAAGEVIQRPASVIKELVENAVDAGATDIRIYLKDAGRTLIQVVDNGCGMSTVDARMAFERHATSKITRADDLFRLHTMGFRGEALPSICAISQVEVKTRTEDSEMGTQLVINGSKVESQTPCICDKGTSISVRNIFFNVPARRKFLKSDNVELSNVMREFERLALVNNNIRLSIDTGNRKLDLRSASLHQRIHDIWKNNLKMELLPVEVDTQLVKIHGYVSRPEYARRRNALQFLIVNGRNMRHPYFHKAIMSCFEGLISSDTQPCYFLKFEVDPSTIDVNIHPTKNEIKFEYEAEIWPLIVAGVKASLGKNAAVPSIDFTADALPAAPQLADQLPTRPTMELPPDYNPFDSYRETEGFDVNTSRGPASPRGGFSGGGGYSPSHTSGRGPERSNLRNWEQLYSQFVGDRRALAEAEKDDFPAELTASLPGMEQEGNVGNLCMQFALKYIITSTREGIVIIDQHRAHLKILFERIMAKVSAGTGVSQRVMFADTINLEPTLQSALSEVEPELRRIGFELEYDEGEQWKITAVPADLRGDARDIILRILDSVSEDSANYGSDQRPVESMLERVALLMARGEAITRGRRLTNEEMETLISELFALPDPAYTPAGNKIYTTLDEQAIFRLLN